MKNLIFWHDGKVMVSSILLQRIASDILVIPVTTVTSEFAFSTSGRLLSPHHSRLHPKTIEAIMCAQNWLWSEIKG